MARNGMRYIEAPDSILIGLLTQMFLICFNANVVYNLESHLMFSLSNRVWCLNLPHNILDNAPRVAVKALNSGLSYLAFCVPKHAISGYSGS